MEDTRLACLDTPALPLQLLLRRRPDWRHEPVVVVQDDKPTAVILWANKIAQKSAIRPGMRFAEARTLATSLRADVVEAAEIAQGVDALYRVLLRFTPYVEPDEARPGLFWLDPRGLMQLYPNLQAWSAAAHAAVRAEGFACALVIGFNRFFMVAQARTRLGVLVLDTPSQEAARAADVPLAQLDWSPTLLHALSTLGVRHVSAFLSLPGGDIRQRLGAEAEVLHRLGHAKGWVPLRPRFDVAPLRQAMQLEPPAIDHDQLLFAIKSLLHPLLDSLRTRCEALTRLQIHFDLDHAPSRCEELLPASPTLDARLLLELVRLRLASAALPAPVEQIALSCVSQRVTLAQLALLEHQNKPRRDPIAAAQAIARLRAAFGDTAVTRARLCAGHLPEARFLWEPARELSAPVAMTAASPDMPLMRQVLPRPRPLSTRDKDLLQVMAGPFRVSGAWWARQVERDYYFGHNSRAGHDEIAWIYYDRPRRRWFLHGIVD